MSRGRSLWKQRKIESPSAVTTLTEARRWAGDVISGLDMLLMSLDEARDAFRAAKFKREAYGASDLLQEAEAMHDRAMALFDDVADLLRVAQTQESGRV